MSSSSRRKRGTRSRKNATRGLDSGSASSLTIIRPSDSVFSDRYRTRLHCTSATTVSAVAATYYTFYGNAIVGCGPQSSFAGGFAANHCTGAIYLISSGAAGGASAPYLRARVWGSRITVRVTSNNGNAIGANLAVTPTPSVSFAGMSVTQTVEQPYSKHKIIPQSTTTQNQMLTSRMSTRQIIGLSSDMAVEGNPNFEVAYNSTPTTPWYWQMSLVSTDGGSTNFNYSLLIDIEYDVEFFRRTPFSTAAPT